MGSQSATKGPSPAQHLLFVNKVSLAHSHPQALTVDHGAFEQEQWTGDHAALWALCIYHVTLNRNSYNSLISALHRKHETHWSEAPMVHETCRMHRFHDSSKISAKGKKYLLNGFFKNCDSVANVKKLVIVWSRNYSHAFTSSVGIESKCIQSCPLVCVSSALF